MTQRLVGTASMRRMTFLQVDRCSNEPFSTYCVYCVFYKLILRLLLILQIVILEYCVYCVFYKLTSTNIAYIAYIALRCVALRILQQAIECGNVWFIFLFEGFGSVHFNNDNDINNNNSNRIDNKILDRDWFSARLFIT